MYALAGADLRAILDGAYELLGVTEPEQLPGAMLKVVDRLVRSDLASYNEIDLLHGRANVVTAGGPPPDPEQAVVFAGHALENPIVAHQSSTGDGSPRRLSDFVTSRQFQQRPIYSLIYGPLGIETQLAFGLDQPGPEVIGFALSRGHSDFGERDVAVLTTLRPLLAQIRASLKTRSRIPERLSAELEAARLTPRQRDVMSLLVRGATNHQIAIRLQISEKTVAKHLEHVFRRLGVTNRTAAVAAWRTSPDT